MKYMGAKKSLQPKIAITLIAILTLVIFACSSCGTPSFSQKTQQEVDKAVKEVMSKFDIPGAVVGVWVPGEGTWIKTKGEADLKTGQAMKLGDKFRIGSITKTFTTTVILELVDEGLLSLDDTLDKFVPSVPNGSDITIRQLCNNTSGLFNYGDDENLVATIEKDPRKKWTPQELVDIAVSRGPYSAPGEELRYSNTNFILLGMIIEEVTGNKLRDEIRKRITEPLGLKNTSLPDSPKMTGEYSHGYGYMAEGDEELEDFTTYLDPSLVWAAGAMISNLDDLKIWARALADGELLDKKTQKERLTWVDFPEGEGLAKYGLGIFYMGGFIGHDGRTPGYNCDMFYFPSKEATIIVMLNLSDESEPALGLFMKIAKIIFPKEAPW